MTLEAIEVARKAVEAASDKQASDILLLDARGVCSFADYFVICSGDSDRQIEAIRDEVGHMLKREGILPRHYEGTVDSGMSSCIFLLPLSGSTTSWMSCGARRTLWSGFSNRTFHLWQRTV